MTTTSKDKKRRDKSHLRSVLPTEPDPNSNVETLPPWHGAVIPDGYEIKPDGVYQVTRNDESRKISGPIWEVAKTRNPQGKEWGSVYKWIDQDGGEHERAFANKRLHDRSCPLVQQLADEGLHVVPGRGIALMQYLGSFDTTTRWRAVSQTGWLTANTEYPVFVLPNEVITLTENERVIFQPERHSPSTDTMHAKGHVEHWKTQVAKPCCDNPILVFSLCAAFAGPLLKFAELDCMGIHLYGKTSQGKTTALQVAASVWGCGTDPAATAGSYIQRWNSTGNALEGLAAAHNDGLLVLDEMGTCDANDFGKVVYNLAGGQGKARLTKESELQARRTWRLLYLSSGEISAQQKIEESGKPARAGQLNRLMDIPVTDQIIRNPHRQAPHEFVDGIKHACGHSYGTAGPEFLRALVRHYSSVHELRRTIQQDVDLRADKLMPDRDDLTADQKRCVRRLTLVLVAGLLANELGILPIESKGLWASVTYVRDRWLSVAIAESLRGVLNVRDFILTHKDARFLDMHEFSRKRPPIRDLAGYWDTQKSLYLFTDTGFKSACGGHNPTDVAQELRDRELLHRTKEKRFKSKHTIPGVGRPRLYAVKADIVDFDVQRDNLDGAGGAAR